MGELTARQARIVDRLLRMDSGLTLVLLAAELGTSTRTVQRDLPAVTAWLSHHGITLTVRSRLGLVISASPAQRESALTRLARVEPGESLSPEERQALILQDLLQMRDGAKLAYFSRRYRVTEATISRDLDRLEPWLNQRELTLVRRPGFGLEVTGAERAWRQAIIDFMRGNLSDEEIFALISRIRKEPAQLTGDSFFQQFLSFVDEQTATQIERLVRELEAQLADPMVESAFAGLVVHLALTIERLRRADTIAIPPAVVAQLKETAEWERAAELAVRVSETLKITLPEAEIGYITMHLRGARLRTSSVPVDSEEHLEALSLAQAMVARAEELLGAPVAETPGLTHSLAVHLAPAINRLRLGLAIRNPLLPRIKAEYPELFAASQQVCKILAGHLGLPVSDEEVGYVAMHLGAALERLRSSARARFRAVLVCPTGIGSSQMLASRLGSAMPEIEVINLVPLHELPSFVDRLAAPPDLILSTVAMEFAAVPVVVVSPLLGPADLARVRAALPVAAGQQTGDGRSEGGAAIEPDTRVQRVSMIGWTLLELLNSLRIDSLGDREPLTAAVELALGSRQTTDPERVRHDLARREALGSTMVGPHLQLLHARTGGVDAAFVGLLQSPVRTVLVMLAPTEAAPETLEVLGAISVALVERPEFVRLLRTGSLEAVRNAISSLIQTDHDHSQKAGNDHAS